MFRNYNSIHHCTKGIKKSNRQIGMNFLLVRTHKFRMHIGIKQLQRPAVWDLNPQVDIPLSNLWLPHLSPNPSELDEPAKPTHSLRGTRQTKPDPIAESSNPTNLALIIIELRHHHHHHHRYHTNLVRGEGRRGGRVRVEREGSLHDVDGVVVLGPQAAVAAPPHRPVDLHPHTLLLPPPERSARRRRGPGGPLHRRGTRPPPRRRGRVESSAAFYRRRRGAA